MISATGRVLMAMKRLIRSVLRDLAFLLAAIVAPFVRRETVMLFGPPILTLKYIKAAISTSDYRAITFVNSIYKINDANDFDYLSRNPFLFFNQFIRSTHVVIFYDSIEQFFGPLGRVILPLYKRWVKLGIVVMPYGADAFVYSEISDTVLRHALLINYPSDVSYEGVVKRRIREANLLADVVVGCLGHIGNLPRWDILPVHYYPVDVKAIQAIIEPKYQRFTIVHAPNHRGVKGTALILRAVEELQNEGSEIDIRILENLPNHLVLKELVRSHLLIDQVLGGGYALSAIEAMAAGLPVICHLNHQLTAPFRIFSYLNQCPIVGVERDVASIKKAIIHCQQNYQDISLKSKEYVETFHSIESNGILWKKILRATSTGERLINYCDPNCGDYRNDINSIGSNT